MSGQRYKTPESVVSSHFADLRGKLLTIIEAIVPAGEQCDAAKSLARRELSEIQRKLNVELRTYIEELGYVRKRERNQD